MCVLSALVCTPKKEGVRGEEKGRESQKQIESGGERDREGKG